MNGDLAFCDEFVANFACSFAASTCLFIAPVNKRATLNRPRLQRGERAMFEFNEPTARRTADYGGGRVYWLPLVRPFGAFRVDNCLLVIPAPLFRPIATIGL